MEKLLSAGQAQGIPYPVSPVVIELIYLIQMFDPDYRLHEKSSNHIRKVNLKPLKYQRSYEKHYRGKDPEVSGGIKMLKEPHMIQ